MNKRHFLAAATLAGAVPALLTVTGAVAKANRGPFDPALDQMMHKQKLSFQRAFVFDFAALARFRRRLRPATSRAE